MFISIPKNLLIPSVFTKEFSLNEDNNHLEFDTELSWRKKEYRSGDQGIGMGENDDDERINAMYTDLDEEYANESVGAL